MMNKFRFLAIVIAFLMLVSCGPKKGFVIDGKVDGSTAKWAFIERKVDGKYNAFDSVQLSNGKFEFSGESKDIELYYINIDKTNRILVFVDAPLISIKANDTIKGTAIITGGVANELYKRFSQDLKEKNTAMMDLYKTVQSMPSGSEKDSLEKLADAEYDAIDKFQEDFVTKNLNSPVAVYVLSRITYGKNAEELQTKLDAFSPSLKSMDLYNSIQKRVEILKQVAIGQQAPDFMQNDSNDKPITLSDVYKSNKLTLVDFWASWCGPCRAENPNVVAAYQKYHSKGLEILGVSLDKTKEKWLDAIAKDNLTWIHVSDLNYWDNAFSKVYGVNSIPANFLIDQSGKIIATNLRGDDLLTKLDEMLK